MDSNVLNALLTSSPSAIDVERWQQTVGMLINQQRENMATTITGPTTTEFEPRVAHSMDNQLYSFLRRRGVLDEFVSEVINFVNRSVMHNFQDRISTFGSAFDWDSTARGSDYWSNLDREYKMEKPNDVVNYAPSMENPYGTQMNDFTQSLRLGSADTGRQEVATAIATKSDTDELKERMASAEGILNSLVVQVEGAHEAIRIIAELIEGKIPESEKRQRKTDARDD